MKCEEEVAVLKSMSGILLPPRFSILLPCQTESGTISSMSMKYVDL